jgi:ABC-type glycerol-3-phosphate transport system permease component
VLIVIMIAPVIVIAAFLQKNIARGPTMNQSLAGWPLSRA